MWRVGQLVWGFLRHEGGGDLFYDFMFGFGASGDETVRARRDSADATDLTHTAHSVCKRALPVPLWGVYGTRWKANYRLTPNTRATHTTQRAPTEARGRMTEGHRDARRTPRHFVIDFLV